MAIAVSQECALLCERHPARKQAFRHNPSHFRRPAGHLTIARIAAAVLAA